MDRYLDTFTRYKYENKPILDQDTANAGVAGYLNQHNDSIQQWLGSRPI